MPDSPQQNGRAERWNRTITEKALSMLHHAGLSHGFWQLAIEAAVHIYNRQPMRRLKWRCPITLWDGTIPDVSYFRVFGCKAYVHVQKDKRKGKLDKKAVEMIFVSDETQRSMLQKCVEFAVLDARSKESKERTKGRVEVVVSGAPESLGCFVRERIRPTGR